MTDDLTVARGAEHSGAEHGYQYVRDASVRGGREGVVALVGRSALRLSAMVLLARLLTPEDFGLVAMAGIVLSWFHIVADLGLHMAAVQRRQIGDEELSTLFWINVGGGILLAALTIASAPLLVRIFDEPRLAGAAAVLSLTLVGVGIGTQHEAIIRRRLNYGFLHMAGVISEVAGLGAALLAAVGGLGYWAVILHQIVTQAARVVLLWSKTGWRPRSFGRLSDVAPLLRYGSRLIPAHLLAHAARNFGEIIVGVGSGAASLGLFKRAHSIATMAEEAKLPLKSIVPASLSRLQDRTQEFSRFYIYAISLSSLAGCGIVGWVTAEAPAATRLILGDQWLAITPLIRLLAPAGIVAALGSASEWMLMPLGEMNRLLVLRMLRLTIVIVGVLVGWRWGVEGVAVGYSVASCVSLVSELVGTATRVPTHGLTGALVRPILAAAGAGYVVFRIVTPISVGTLVLELLLYTVLFAAIHAALPGGWRFMNSLLRAIRKATYV